MSAGDLNNDGEVNITDIMTTVNYILTVIDLSDNQICSADLDDDGLVTITDILLMVNIILYGG